MNESNITIQEKREKYIAKAVFQLTQVAINKAKGAKIWDVEGKEYIDFVGGIRGLGELEKRVDSGEMEVAFSMFPVSMQQLIDISDNDMIMPPKVTWFEPKLRSGLFVHDLAE